MEQEQVVECGGVLDITVVAEWCEKARAALLEATPIRLKADGIQRVDAAGLQALLGLFLAAEKQAIPVHWENPANTLREAARLIGVDHYLRLA